MPILRYGSGVIKWTRHELRAIDCKTRKILFKYKLHHPKSYQHRLNLSKKRGGRGLIGARACYRQEYTKLAQYLDNNTTDPLVKIVRDAGKTKVYSIMSYIDKERGGPTEEIDKEHFANIIPGIYPYF